MTALVGLALLLAVLYHRMSPESRARTLEAAVRLVREVIDFGRPELEPFWTPLRARTPIAFVTLALAAVNVLVFGWMVFASGSLSDPATLIRAGASTGFRTTNGEWWRLVTASFVHGGFIALSVDLAVLLQLGLLLERLVGGVAFASIYLTAALLAQVANLRSAPLGLSLGASGGLCGLYGLLLAAFVRGRLHRSDRSVPILALLRLAPLTVVFTVFSLIESSLGSAAVLTGAAVGVVFGLVVLGSLAAGAVPRRRVGTALATALVLAVVEAAPLRGMVDVTPQIQHVVELEQRTDDAYQQALDTFKKQGTDIEVLTRFIDGEIIPELQKADAQLKALKGVPRDDQWRITDAREYVRLRVESWRFRAQGLREEGAPARGTLASRSGASFAEQATARHRASELAFGQADAAERAALERLDRLRAP